MMKYSRQDLPKIIVLSIVLAGVLVYIGVTYAKLSAKNKALLEAEHRAHERAAAAYATAIARASGAGPSPTVAALLNPTPPPQRDPFRPLIAPGGYRQTQETARSEPTENTSSALPPLPGPETTAGRSSNVLRVTGIVVGRPSVAVLRRGEDVFIVQPGDVLNGGLRVQSVSRTSVTLRDNQRSYVLRLGE
jgi:hypothetical protein